MIKSMLRGRSYTEEGLDCSKFCFSGKRYGRWYKYVVDRWKGSRIFQEKCYGNC